MFSVNYQKTSLIDYPNLVSATAFTLGCPLRCLFCHNPDLVLPQLADHENKADEFLAYLNKRKTLLDGVVISGGEPLMQVELDSYLNAIKALGLKIKLDTSGYYPERLKALIDSKLVDYIALDYKNQVDKLSATCNISNEKAVLYHQQWQQSLAYLRASDMEYELRTTLVGGLHEQEDLLVMAELLETQEMWYIQSFVKQGLLINDYQETDQLELNSWDSHELDKMIQGLKKIHQQIELR